MYFLVNSPGLGTLDHGIWKYTYLSGDGTGNGGTWDDRTDNVPQFGGLAGDFDSQGSYDLVIKVKPDDPDVVFIGGTNLYRSTDGFASVGNSAWIGGYDPNVDDFVRVNNHHPDIHEIIFSPSDPLVMYNGTDGGVSRTVDDLASNVTWESLNRGYYTTQFYSVGIVPGIPGSNIIIGGMQDNGTYFFNSDISVADWVEIFSGDGAFNAISRDGTHYYISAQGGLTFRFDLNLNGAVIGGKLGRIDMGGSGFLFINPFILNPVDDTMMFMVRGEELWRNSNVLGISIPGDSPTMFNWETMTNAKIPGETMSALTMTEIPENRLYYGTDKSSVLKIEGADQGDPIPVNITSPEFSSGAYVSSIAADPTDGDNVMVTFSNYQVRSLFFSGDGGSTWTDVGGNLEENTDGTGNGPSVRWAYIHHTDTGSDPVYFVGTSTGLYSTSVLDGSATQWVQEGAATIGNIIVDMIVGRISDGVVVVATHGGGVYKSTIVTVVEDKVTAVPSLFELDQNFPNPFNPETTISFTLGSSVPVTLKIYNALGQEVKTLLAREKRSAGGHKELFDGRTDNGTQLSSGIYFYRLDAGNFNEIKKMVLVK